MNQPGKQSVRNVYLLFHTVRADTDDESSKLIGVFSSRKRAESALQTASKLPGFCEYLSGFCIDKYCINQLEWSEGFFTEYYREDPAKGKQEH